MPRAAKQSARVRPKNARAGSKAAAKPATGGRSRSAKRASRPKNDQPSAKAAATVVLSDCLDASAAAAIRTMLLERRGSALIVDASEVRRIGVQSLQVLLSAARTWQADAMSYVLANPSPAFLDTIALAGLSRQSLLLEGPSP